MTDEPKVIKPDKEIIALLKKIIETNAIIAEALANPRIYIKTEPTNDQATEGVNE